MASSPITLEGLLFDDPRREPRSGWLTLRDGRIEARGEGRAPRPADLGGPGRIIVPGFIDAHIHLPQIGSVGCRSDNLLSWLDRVIFPAEAKWGDPEAAEQEMRRALERMLAAGTLGAATYLTSHAHGPSILHRVHAALPLRLHAGQAAMDRGGPTSLTSDPLAALPPDGDRLQFSINPRFAVSCTPQLLDELGRIAQERGCLVQTHLAEQSSECTLVAQLFPEHPHYTGVYDHFGLLHARTLLAHAIHLSADEWALIARRTAVVVHCPAANTFLESGIFDFRRALAARARIALGSDVAAGADLAMPRVARAMIETAILRRLSGDANAHVPTAAEAWTMITAGNARHLGFLDHGTLAAGDRGDLLVLRPDITIDEHLAGRLIFGWDNAMIEHRLLQGQPVCVSHRRSAGH